MEVTVRRHVKGPVSPFVSGSFWRLFKRRGNPHPNVPPSSAFQLIRHDSVIKAASRHTAAAAVGWIVAGERGEGEERKKRLISNQGSRNDTELNLQQDVRVKQPLGPPRAEIIWFH